MSDAGKKLAFTKKLNGKLHRVQNFPEAELKFPFFFIIWVSSSLMSLSVFSHRGHSFVEVQNKYFCNSSIHYSAAAIQQEAVHILTLCPVLPCSCTEVVVTPYTFTLPTHKPQGSLALLFGFVLRPEHNKYIENYINRTYPEKKLQYSLTVGMENYCFYLTACFSKMFMNTCYRAFSKTP